MGSPSKLNQILNEYRQRLSEILGDDLDSVVLFGSQARGEAIAGSDIDVLCIMKNSFNYGDLISRTSLATAEISLAHDVVISRVFIPRDAYTAEDSPIIMKCSKRTGSDMNSGIEALLTKARESLAAAHVLIKDGYYDFGA